MEVGYDGLFALAGGSIPPRLVAVLRRRRLADAAIDVGGRAEIAVAQPFLNLLERHVAGQQEAGA